MKDILLLHGAIGAADQLQPLRRELEGEYNIHTLSFSGHGGNDFPPGGFSIPVFAGDVLAYMAENGLQQVDVFGYSMGGYVALYLAKHHPERIGRIVTLATKFHWDEPTAAKEVQMVNADKIEAKLPAFAQALKDRHAPSDWKAVLKHTIDMLTALGANNTLNTEDYTTITNNVLVLLGDKDRMVGLDETVAVYKALPNAAMGMLPGTQHPIEQVDTALLAYFIKRFI